MARIWSASLQTCVNISENTPEGGKFAFKSLLAATNALQKGEVDVLVTAPINKQNIQSDSFQFPGHTEYLERNVGQRKLASVALVAPTPAALRDACRPAHWKRQCSLTRAILKGPPQHYIVTTKGIADSTSVIR